MLEGDIFKLWFKFRDIFLFLNDGFFMSCNENLMGNECLMCICSLFLFVFGLYIVTSLDCIAFWMF